MEGAVGLNGSLPGVRLHSDSFRTIVSLEYLSLKNLELSDAPSDSQAETDVDEPSVDENDVVFLNLTFESIPQENQDNVNIVPYEIYQMQKLNEYSTEELWDGFVKLTKLKCLIIVECILPEGLTNSRQSASLSSLTHLKMLTIESSHLRTNPSFSQGHLPELEILSLANNSILQLQKEELQGLTHVRSLDLSRNNLSRLIERSFPELLRLESIDLRANPLQVIYAGAFSGLSAVKSLQIGSWDLSTIQYSSFHIWIFISFDFISTSAFQNQPIHVIKFKIRVIQRFKVIWLMLWYIGLGGSEFAFKLDQQ